MQSLHFQADQIDPWMLTFHLPLHRYLSVFAYQAIYSYNISPSRFLPVDDELALSNLMFFPLRTLVGEEWRSWRSLSSLLSVGLLRSSLEHLAAKWSTADDPSEDLREKCLFLIDARCWSVPAPSNTDFYVSGILSILRSSWSRVSSIRICLSVPCSASESCLSSSVRLHGFRLL